MKKEKQKTFITWSVPTEAGELQVTKFFCLFLFKKRRLLPTLDLIAFTYSHLDGVNAD